MRPIDFAKYLTDFLSDFLPVQKNVSKNTIFAYRDTFKLLLKYCQEIKKISIEPINMDILTVELLKNFLNWLENEKRYGVTTRNLRLGINSFIFPLRSGRRTCKVFIIFNR